MVRVNGSSYDYHDEGGVMKFQPLSMQRLIRDDRSLTATEKGLLLCGVLRTDNPTRRVRASLQVLAKDAGVGYRTARRAFAPDNNTVLRYFEKVERGKRHVNLTFAHPDDVPAARSELAVVAASSIADTSDEAAVVAREVVTVTGSGGQDGQPSASLSLTSAPPPSPNSHERDCSATVEDDVAEVHHPGWPTVLVEAREPAATVPISGPRRRLERPSIGDGDTHGQRDDRSPAGRGPRAYRRRGVS
jgi:hypothetical protein